MKLKRITSGLYRSPCGRFHVVRVLTPLGQGWQIKDTSTRHWTLTRTLDEARTVIAETTDQAIIWGHKAPSHPVLWVRG